MQNETSTVVKPDVLSQQPGGQNREVILQTQGADSFALMPNQHQISQYSDYLKNFNAFIDSNLTKSVDYGTIPGVQKPSLFKPGAEKLEKLLSLRHEKVLVEKIIEPGYTFVKYSYKTIVYNKRNEIVATCEGSCNSKEKKYRYDFNKQEKKDFYDMENTIMKMAQKRSYVGAMLEATNSSGRFTQDVEDMSAEDLGRGNKAPTPAPTQSAPAMHAPVATRQSTPTVSPETPANEYDPCNKCNGERILNPKTGKVFCKAKCWLNT